MTDCFEEFIKNPVDKKWLYNGAPITYTFRVWCSHNDCEENEENFQVFVFEFELNNGIPING